MLFKILCYCTNFSIVIFYYNAHYRLIPKRAVYIFLIVEGQKWFPEINSLPVFDINILFVLEFKNTTGNLSFELHGWYTYMVQNSVSQLYLLILTQKYKRYKNEFLHMSFSI